MLYSIPPLQDHEEDVSYDVESLNYIHLTINYIIEQIYVHKELTPIYLKLIFRRLLIKLNTEFTFKFNSRFFNQVDGCTMRGPLSVTFSDIYMVKMVNNVVITSKPIFHCKFVDDIYSRRKLGDNVLFDRLNNYHPIIKLTIEVNPRKVLVTKLININGAYKFNVKTQNYLHHFRKKTQNYLHHGPQKGKECGDETTKFV